MKKVILIGLFAMLSLVNTTFGQDLQQNQVPSLIVNNFQQAFLKASDIEWEMDGALYKVEFETGLLGSDHSAWYDKAGKLIKHKEEISKSDLPQKVLAKLSTEYSSYSVDDVKKITEGTKVYYKLELDSFTEDWKVAFDAEGNVLSKIAD